MRINLSKTFLAFSLLFANHSLGYSQNSILEKEVDELMKKMTLEEKVGQMAQITLDVIMKGNGFVSEEPAQLDKAKLNEALVKWKVGSILNTPNNRARTVGEWHEIIGEIQEVAMKQTRLGIPVIYGIDAIHGTTYTADAVLFPQQIGMAATWNPELVYEGARITAYETRASSIPWTFSPVLDMGNSACWPRMWETFGEDVLLTSVMGVEMVKGYEGKNIGDKYNVASCLKHYIGYSAALSGKDRTPAYIPEYLLREIYLPPFAAAVKAGAHTVMVNSGLINGLPVHADKKLITDLLKNELGFNGIVVTDWADIENIHNRDKVAENQKESVRLAINAGIDMSMIPYNYDFCKYLIELVNEGEVAMTRIDDAVRRILLVKKELGLFTTPVSNPNDYPDFASQKHRQKAYDAAAESVTLLKNKNNLLPLSNVKKLLVTGPNGNSMRTLNGGWSYSWQGEKVEEFIKDYNNIYKALQSRFGADNVTYVAGVEYNMEGKYYEEHTPDIQKAVDAAKNADAIVLCIGENSYTEKPGDLDDLTISKNQIRLAEALLATGKPVIVVLNEGRPRIITEFAHKADAILMTYLPGNMGGEAIADILTGKVNPSGKLPFTYPMYTNSLITYNHKHAENQEKMPGAYDYEGAVNILFPFGYGLSYTTFEYSDLQLNKSAFGPNDEVSVSVKVKNTGKRAGKEVIQVYYSDLFASLAPDNKRLCAFEKINLQPGEIKNLTFNLPLSAFSFVDHQNQRITEKGTFRIQVDKLEKEFSVTENLLFNNMK